MLYCARRVAVDAGILIMCHRFRSQYISCCPSTASIWAESPWKGIVWAYRNLIRQLPVNIVGYNNGGRQMVVCWDCYLFRNSMAWSEQREYNHHHLPHPHRLTAEMASLTGPLFTLSFFVPVISGRGVKGACEINILS